MYQLTQVITLEVGWQMNFCKSISIQRNLVKPSLLNKLNSRFLQKTSQNKDKLFISRILGQKTFFFCRDDLTRFCFVDDGRA